MDYTAMTDEELMEVVNGATLERNRRYTARTIPGQIDSLNRQFLASTGVTEGQEWVQPVGAHDAYPQGWRVTHNGQEWVSLTTSNVWEPGVSGWGIVVPEGELPPWVQPSGAHDAYNNGALVSHKGQDWISRVDANVWEPGVSGWDPFDPDEEFARQSRSVLPPPDITLGGVPEANLLSPMHPTPLGVPRSLDDGPDDAFGGEG